MWAPHPRLARADSTRYALLAAATQHSPECPLSKNERHKEILKRRLKLNLLARVIAAGCWSVREWLSAQREPSTRHWFRRLWEPRTPAAVLCVWRREGRINFSLRLLVDRGCVRRQRECRDGMAQRSTVTRTSTTLGALEKALPTLEEGSKELLKSFQEIDGNSACVDCASLQPDWASVTLGCLVCLECSGNAFLPLPLPHPPCYVPKNLQSESGLTSRTTPLRFGWFHGLLGRVRRAASEQSSGEGHRGTPIAHRRVHSHPAGKHRALGVRYSFVRSVKMDKWSEKQIALMKAGGNAALNRFLTQRGVPAEVRPFAFSQYPPVTKRIVHTYLSLDFLAGVRMARRPPAPARSSLIRLSPSGQTHIVLSFAVEWSGLEPAARQC